MTRLYLIRHAEAEGNLYRRAQGQWNTKITDLGIRQTEALAERFKCIHLDAIYSSDLTRAVLTAEALREGRPLQLIKNAQLREMNMGEWEGEAWGDIIKKYPGQMAYFNHDPAKLTVPGSEKFSDLQKRIKDALLKIAADHKGQTVAVVSHGMAIRCFLCGALGFSSSEIDHVQHGDNTSVSLIEIADGKITVVFYNDSSHLTEGLSNFSRHKWWNNGTGAKRINLSFVPMNLSDKAEAELYQRCYADTWRESHGSEKGFVPDVYLKSARTHAKETPEAVVKVMDGSDFAGIIELDSVRGKREKHGWITLFYLVPEYRGKGVAVQLLGYSVFFYSKLGRERLRLHAAITNARAIGFYQHYGFKIISTDKGVSSDQFLMEKDI